MKKLVYLIIFLLYSAGMNAQLKDLVQYVNTLQGTDSNFGLSYGNTYPTTGMPYGMHMWSAQTGKNGNGFKYLYASDKIRAFSLLPYQYPLFRLPAYLESVPVRAPAFRDVAFRGGSICLVGNGRNPCSGVAFLLTCDLV